MGKLITFRGGKFCFCVKGRRINCSGKQRIGGVPAQCHSPIVEGAVCFWLAPFPILNCFSLRSFREDGGRQTIILTLSARKTVISVLHRHCAPCTAGTVGAMHGLSGHTVPLGGDVMDVYCTAAFRQDAPGGGGAVPSPAHTIVMQRSITFLFFMFEFPCIIS